MRIAVRNGTVPLVPAVLGTHRRIRNCATMKPVLFVASYAYVNSFVHSNTQSFITPTSRIHFCFQNAVKGIVSLALDKEYIPLRSHPRYDSHLRSMKIHV